MPGGAGEDLELARPVMATEVGGIRDGGVPANILTGGARLLPAGLLTAVLPACPRSVIVRAPRSCQKATSAIARRARGGFIFFDTWLIARANLKKETICQNSEKRVKF